MACDNTGDKCKCTYNNKGCPRRGNCCQCVAYHREKGQASACMFTPEGEMMYDRSLANLMRDRGIKL